MYLQNNIVLKRYLFLTNYCILKEKSTTQSKGLNLRVVNVPEYIWIVFCGIVKEGLELVGSKEV